MKLFIKERGASVKAQIQWEAVGRMLQKDIPHLLCDRFCY